MTSPTSGQSGKLDLVSRFSLLISYLIMALIPVIVLIVGYEVVMRYVFGKSTSWVHDLSVWLGAVIYVASGIYAMQQRAHISITFLHDAVPSRMRRVRLALSAVGLLTVLIFAAGLVWGAGPDAWRSLLSLERAGTSWNPPIPGTIKPLILFVVFLIAMQAIVNFIHELRADAPPRETTVEVD
ncbi:TRAP-type mannitol/chloroaromatic compound transport system, small permease component [Roseovarius azorensis]|uniref:TRAP transporter small permease protein n=1 Tax=Roseovarius azorensis TaxID=1287727 RepID=A0A1H7QGG7_9RHOB|nr:TRAP transporter small permease [Roseovarius azorensis]SEL46387.1 TRAP-type mannitol/chloroaromatic compound transport system, small permease component [Roseovarius azorensis]